MNARQTVLVAVLLLALAGCGAGGDPAAVGTVTSPSAAGKTLGGGCPPPDADGNAAIAWVPFVRVKGLMFQKTFSPAATVSGSDLGGTVITVECAIGETVSNPSFRPRDGDAAYLAEGTELREINGYRPDFRLAAWEDGAWHVYEVDDVPDAETGEDMLDLRDKVTAVHLVEGDRGERILQTVHDEDRVAAIVRAVLAAPVLPETSSMYDRLGDESPVFVRFDMVDGTAVQRAWHVESGMLWRRIEVPEILEAELSPRDVAKGGLIRRSQSGVE
jgi:hypothetical protein